jgi:hypothetical protein
MTGGFDKPRPSIETQMAAFKVLVSSDYGFSHVEEPLKVSQAFAPDIHYISVVRHPIERLLSSFAMMKDKTCFDNCTLPLWLRRQCYLNPKVDLGSAAQSTIGVLSALSGSFTTGELDRDYMTRWLAGMGGVGA